MGLEIQTGKVPGTEIRRTPATRPAFAGLLILLLTALEVLFIVLVFAALGNNANNAGAHDPAISKAPLGSLFLNEQTIVSFWLGCVFYCLFGIILLYQRYFTDHVTIAKRRFRKWEDEGVQLHD